MPVCRECHSRISKFDKDRCPVCGCVNPLEGVSSETVEVTSQLDLSNSDFKDYKPTNKTPLMFLFILLGFTGAPFFYLKFPKKGIIALISGLVFIGGLGSILAFLTPLSYIWGYLIPVITIYVFYIVFGLIFVNREDAKDGHGEFIK